MRKTILWLAAAMMTGSVWADVCSDLTTQYGILLTRLQQDTQGALSVTTDPAEQDAIRASFEAQKASLIAERDSALASSNCLNNTPPAPTPTPSPTPSPTPEPNPGPDPVTGPGDGGVTPPTDPGSDPTTGPGNDQACKDLMDQVKTEAQAKAASGGRKAAVAYIRSRRAELKALCGGDGYGRCHRKDKNEDEKKGGRDEHHDRCEKPETPKETPKCEPKPEPKRDSHEKPSCTAKPKSGWKH